MHQYQCECGHRITRVIFCALLLCTTFLTGPSEAALGLCRSLTWTESSITVPQSAGGDQIPYLRVYLVWAVVSGVSAGQGGV